MRPPQGVPDVHAMEGMPGDPAVIQPLAPLSSLPCGTDEQVPRP